MCSKTPRLYPKYWLINEWNPLTAVEGSCTVTPFQLFLVSYVLLLRYGFNHSLSSTRGYNRGVLWVYFTLFFSLKKSIRVFSKWLHFFRGGGGALFVNNVCLIRFWTCVLKFSQCVWFMLVLIFIFHFGQQLRFSQFFVIA